MTSDLNPELSKMTGARQTMSSWSKNIESFEDIPDIYKSFYKTAVGDFKNFPHTVLAPPIAGMRRRNSVERLICEANDTIYIWTRSGKQITSMEYSLNNISDFEVGRILLFSWLTIHGVTNTGEKTTSTIEFNTSSFRHYEYFVNKMRSMPSLINKHIVSEGKNKFESLADENFKFMNYATESLMGGEEVVKIVWQPEMSNPVFALWGHVFHRRILSMAHLVILTNKELILIQEDERSTLNRGVRYGGKWQYIALNKIKAVSVLERADDLLALVLTFFPGERQVEIMFMASKRQDLIQFQAEFNQMMAVTQPL
ncbi:MAG: hypothetical protein U0Z26_07120 [Anaerolineales bacterium]